MPLGDVEDDRSRLEQNEIAFFVRRNLAKGLKCQMRGRLHLLE